MKWFGRGKKLRPAIGSGTDAESVVPPSDEQTPATDAAAGTTGDDTSNAHELDSSSAIEAEAVEGAVVGDPRGHAGPASSEAGGLGSVGLIEASEQIGTEPATPLTEDKSKPNGWWHTTRRVTGWISTIFMIVLLFLAWPLAWGGLFSYTIVSGNSMEPTYHTGDVVMTYRTSEYQVGEIIVYTVTFDDKTGAIIHRIIEALPNGTYKTKGDNNSFVDPWVADPENIRGEVIAVFPQAYKVIALIRSPLFWIIPIGVMVGYFLWPAPVPEIATDDEDGEPEEGDGGDPGENPDGSTDQPTDSEPRNPSTASR